MVKVNLHVCCSMLSTALIRICSLKLPRPVVSIMLCLPVCLQLYFMVSWNLNSLVVAPHLNVIHWNQSSFFSLFVHLFPVGNGWVTQTRNPCWYYFISEQKVGSAANRAPYLSIIPWRWLSLALRWILYTSNSPGQISLAFPSCGFQIRVHGVYRLKSDATNSQ